MSLSLCMIVRNEENCLAQCLDSVKDCVDEIIIVDTGSTDGTKLIATEYTSKIYDFAWNDSFSDARNFSLSKATGDLILWLDADDVVPVSSQKDIQAIRQVNDLKVAYQFVINNLNCVDYVQCFLKNWPEGYPHLKVFPNHRGIKFDGNVHENVLSSLSERKDIEIRMVRTQILHYGYVSQKEVDDSLLRNIKIVIQDEIQKAVGVALPVLRYFREGGFFAFYYPHKLRVYEVPNIYVNTYDVSSAYFDLPDSLQEGFLRAVVRNRTQYYKREDNQLLIDIEKQVERHAQLAGVQISS